MQWDRHGHFRLQSILLDGCCCPSGFASIAVPSVAGGVNVVVATVVVECLPVLDVLVRLEDRLRSGVDSTRSRGDMNNLGAKIGVAAGLIVDRRIKKAVLLAISHRRAVSRVAVTPVETVRRDITCGTPEVVHKRHVVIVNSRVIYQRAVVNAVNRAHGTTVQNIRVSWVAVRIVCIAVVRVVGDVGTVHVIAVGQPITIPGVALVGSGHCAKCQSVTSLIVAT